MAKRRWDLPSGFLDLERVGRYPYGGLAAHELGYIGEINDELSQGEICGAFSVPTEG